MIVGALAFGFWAAGVSTICHLARQANREDARASRLRRLGDSQWRADEQAMWRTGIDPCPQLEDPFDVAAGEAAKWAATLEDVQRMRFFRREEWVA